MALTKRTLPLAALALGLSLVSAGSQAIPLSVSQIGFYDTVDFTGGVISGSFDGTDSNSNGWLEINELTEFTLSYSGDTVISAFTHTLSDVNFFNYALNSSLLGDNQNLSLGLAEGIGTNYYSGSGYAYSTGIGTGGSTLILNNTTFENVVSDEYVHIPTPGVLMLLASALPAFFGFSRANRKAPCSF